MYNVFFQYFINS